MDKFRVGGLEERATKIGVADALIYGRELELAYSALLSQSSELQKDVQVARGQYQGACDIIRRLEANEALARQTIQMQTDRNIALTERIADLKKEHKEFRDATLTALHHAAAALAGAAKLDPKYQAAYDEIDLFIRTVKS